MPLSTNLSVPPYNDDYNPKKDFYRILFRPGVAVQVRELNQLQSLFQAQIERFGDNIFKQGTIVDGCNFSFLNQYAYVKLIDSDISGVPIDVSIFEGLFAVNANNLQGYIVNSADGFEATSPDLKTIYVNYTNSGNSAEETHFTSSDTLTIRDSKYSIFSVVVTDGGLNFANSDEVIFTSSIIVTMSSGTFTVGQTLLQPSTGANVIITVIDTSTMATTNQVVLYFRPQTSDLSSFASNSDSWTFDVGSDIKNSGNTAIGTINQIVGTGAKATVLTNSVGKIKNIDVISRGGGYRLVPQVYVKSPNNASGIAAIDLTAKNYLTQVKVSAGGDSTGFGYAFGVSNGVIYQKVILRELKNKLLLLTNM